MRCLSIELWSILGWNPWFSLFLSIYCLLLLFKNFSPSPSFLLFLPAFSCDIHFCLSVLPPSPGVQSRSYSVIPVSSHGQSESSLSWMASFLRKGLTSLLPTCLCTAEWSWNSALPVSLSRHLPPPLFPSKHRNAVSSPWAASISPHGKVFIWAGRKHVIHIERMCVFSAESLTCNLWQTLVLHTAVLCTAWIWEDCGTFPFGF